MGSSRQSESVAARKAAMQKHRRFLKDLRTAFKAECSRITDASKKKIDKIPESDKERRQIVLKEEEKALDKVLAELNSAIANANRELLKTLEDLDRAKDEQELNGLLEEM